MNRTISVSKFIHWAEQLIIVRTIRSGLINMIPVLIIGAFALVLKTFPVDAYQQFIQKFVGGFLLTIFELVYSATFGALSIYMTFFISRSYIHLSADPGAHEAGAAVSSLISFFILAGINLDSFSTDSTGPKSMFLAIITGIGASAIYLLLCDYFQNHHKQLFSAGVDREFNQMLGTLAPIVLTVLVFALFNAVIIYLFHVDSFRMLLASVFDRLFSIGEVDFLKGLLFVFLSSVLWFFGIHGSDVLEDVMQTYFVPGLAANQSAVAAGSEPSAILTKEFFDCFVLMGGCGSAICLLIAILIFSHNRARRGLGIASSFPMIFNINEMMVFGLPVIFNPVMLIPFIMVPLVCYSIAYVAISIGIVPIITSEVAWTTPILIGGYHATGSFAGSLLQLVNIAVGVIIYIPFVRQLDRQDELKLHREYDSFIDFYRRNETELASHRLIDRNDAYGEFAKSLCAELRYGLKKNVILAYQPQYNFDGKCVGVEALLRWNHPAYGILFPPLVIKLAEEGSFLPDLEEAVLLRALSDRDDVIQHFGSDIKISVNVTGTTVLTPRYLQFCQKLNETDSFSGMNICLEVTEQAALSFNDDTVKILKSYRDMGIMLAIDDFSMGQTSLHYLKDGLFDVIKLDGSLVKGLSTNENYHKIIQSVSQLALNLDLTVLAEFVETEDQRNMLHEIGCDCYQGYLYSPAVYIDESEK